ncbi:MAG: flagellar M-ring protein FliF [Lachnospiraceae bacterium]|nr:flagellar M-ring protein FliF [Lachnospiraceae bacterium]
MAERLRQIPEKLLEWWNKYTSKQKTIIVSVAAGILVAFVILITVLTREQYVHLVTCDSTKDAAAITELLSGADPVIEYQTSDDGYQISVLESQVSQANLLLGANNIPTTAFGIENVTEGGFGTTESDKQKLYKLYLEDLLRTDLESMESVLSANVQLNLPESTGTLIEEEKDSSAAIMLTLDDDFTGDHAANVAQYVKTALGNQNIQTITIIDSQGNLLFSGDDSYSITGSASSQLSVKQQTELVLRDNIRKVLLGTNEFNLIEVASNLQLDFSTQTIVDHQYWAPEGMTQGVLSHEDLYEAETEGGVAGVPGTDSNDSDTPEYHILDGAGSSSTVTERSSDYLPNETIDTREIPAGLILYDESSLSVAAIKYRVIREEDAKEQGLLDGISWEEYKLANNERVKLEVDEDLINMVAMASGIAIENIAMVAYEEPMFIDAEGLAVTATDILQIVLIVLMLLLLAFVILRSMRGEKVTEVEEEVSVENLLQSTPQHLLEDIEVETKSETRLLIEKFVDENPEAAASLLRNWLNEDWD